MYTFSYKTKLQGGKEMLACRVTGFVKSEIYHLESLSEKLCDIFCLFERFLEMIRSIKDTPK